MIHGAAMAFMCDSRLTLDVHHLEVQRGAVGAAHEVAAHVDGVALGGEKGAGEGRVGGEALTPRRNRSRKRSPWGDRGEGRRGRPAEEALTPRIFLLSVRAVLFARAAGGAGEAFKPGPRMPVGVCRLARQPPSPGLWAHVPASLSSL
jgi:hypothetical protein